ncbi:hypothetical protein [Shewanella japonica]|uniref:hypothetical protein n=1 Tax=Shewanella japonica TaxID=93973 RepID=UPI00249589E3|nr:hypothetical protein [Shewanella japonica]
MKMDFEKIQMLYSLEKSLLKTELKHQRKAAFLLAIAMSFFALTVLALNVAIYLSIADLGIYAQKAWWLVALNGTFTVIPGLLLLAHSNHQPDAAAMEIRDALADSLKTELTNTAEDVTITVERMQRIGKDIKAFSEGGIAALVPIVKLASEVVASKKADVPK